MNSRMRVIYLECTTTFRFDQGTGIQRVARNVIRRFLEQGPARGFEIVPVYFEDGEFRAAPIAPDGRLLSLTVDEQGGNTRTRARRFLDRVARIAPRGPLRDFIAAPGSEPGLANSLHRAASRIRRLMPASGRSGRPAPVRIGPEDILFLVDLSLGDDMPSTLAELRAQRTFIGAIVYDLIPIRFPEVFPQTFIDDFRAWAGCVIASCDCLFTISRAVKEDVLRYRAELPAGSFPPSQSVEWFHLGHDMDLAGQNGVPRKELCDVFDSGLPVLLTVGWLDLRKNYARLIEALAELRRRGVNAKLLLVGKRGNGTEHVLAALRDNPQLANDVHLFHDLSDDELGFAFTKASALVYPSYAEGFGLPLVEALTHHLAVLASDIPVFREIAGDDAVYFDPFDVASMVAVLEAFLARGEYKALRAPEKFSWNSWEESVTQLFDLLVGALPREAKR